MTVLVRCPDCGNLSFDPRTGVCAECETLEEEEEAIDLSAYRRHGMALVVLFLAAAYIELPL